MFSRRTSWNTQPSDLSHEVDQFTASDSRPILDLTGANPTSAGFDYDLDTVSANLSGGCALNYTPIPFGMLSGRRAVADYYSKSHGLHLPVEQTCLTTSTSEAYSFLFRLLTDPEDEILYLQPGYPLFDFLADLDGVRLRPVHWFQDGDGWHLDRAGVAQALTAKTRAVLLVHPNNPTGHFTTSDDREWLDAWCAAHGLALIVDEVFLDYAIESPPGVSFLAQPAQALTCVLSGISKISGLPQMKVAWIALHGPSALVNEAAARLDVIADTFLSVNTPMQAALGALLDARHHIQPQIKARLGANLRTLDAALAQQTLARRAGIQGGWYAELRVPAMAGTEAGVIELLRSTAVLLHPGTFFGYASGGIWILSLLTPPEVFTAGIGAALGYLKTFA